MKKIITISREFGAGGGTIGHLVADRLGFEYVGKEIIIQAARDAGLITEKDYNLDDDVPVDFNFSESLFNLYSKPQEERVFEAQKKIIRRFGERGDVVIVGRNAGNILKEFDNSLHCFIHADFNWRLNRLKSEKLQDKTLNQIASEIRKIDKARKNSFEYYTAGKTGEAFFYDICLSTSVLGIEKCADIITELSK